MIRPDGQSAVGDDVAEPLRDAHKTHVWVRPGTAEQHGECYPVWGSGQVRSGTDISIHSSFLPSERGLASLERVLWGVTDAPGECFASIFRVDDDLQKHTYTLWDVAPCILVEIGSLSMRRRFSNCVCCKDGYALETAQKEGVSTPSFM